MSSNYKGKSNRITFPTWAALQEVKLSILNKTYMGLAKTEITYYGDLWAVVPYLWAQLWEVVNYLCAQLWASLKYLKILKIELQIDFLL